jgi:hypothetical protein
MSRTELEFEDYGLAKLQKKLTNTLYMSLRNSKMFYSNGKNK